MSDQAAQHKHTAADGGADSDADQIEEGEVPCQVLLCSGLTVHRCYQMWVRGGPQGLLDPRRPLAPGTAR